MKTIGYIFAVLMKVYEKSLTVEEALELIREIVARSIRDESTVRPESITNIH